MTKHSDTLIQISKNYIDRERVFLYNQQYEFDATVIIEKGCGCSGTIKKKVLHYRVPVDGVNYLIPETHAFKTTVVNNPLNWSFTEVYSKKGQDQTQDYDSLRSNPDPEKIWNDAQNIPM